MAAGGWLPILPRVLLSSVRGQEAGSEPLQVQNASDVLQYVSGCDLNGKERRVLLLRTRYDQER